MCPSSGHGEGWWVRWQRREVQPVFLLVAAALFVLLVVYFFPLLSALVLCAVCGWLYYNSGTAVWRYLDWKQLTGGPPGRRQRPAGHRRQREPGLKWTPSSLLLLMGSYLGKQEPPARAMGRGTRELKERLSRPNPAVPTPARRLSFRETPGISSRALLSPRRRYPIHQPQYSMPGSLPTVYFDGYQKKCLLSPKSSLVRSPVTVKIARPDPNIARSPVLDNLLSPGPVSPLVQCAPDPCAKETVLNAIRESRKRMNKDEEAGASGGLENKRRRQASSGSRDSSFEYPLPNGTLHSYSSRPDSLKRGPNSQVLEDTVNKRSRTSSISSLSNSAMNGIAMSSHNAITSSYSSSKVILQKRKRNQNVSAVSSSPSSRSQTPDLSAKKAREELHDSPLIPVPQDKDQGGRYSETPPSKSSSVNTSENGSGGARRKKVLLVSSGRSDQYPLPPPPLVGYSITSKDFDSEKMASLQRLNKALEDVAGSVPLSSAPTTTVTNTLTSSLFSLPATTAEAAATLTLPTTSTSNNPLLLSLAKMQNKGEAQAPVQTLNTTTSNEKVQSSCEPVILGISNPLKAPSLPVPSVTGSSSSVPLLASETVQTKSELLKSTILQTKSEPSKSSLLQILTKPLENDLQTGFKPIFPTSVTTPLAVSSAGLSTTSAPSANSFTSIFGEQNQPAPTSSTFKPISADSVAHPPTSSSLTFQMNSTSSAASALFSGFGAKCSNTTLSTDSVAKPSLAASTSTTSSSTTNTFTSTLFSSVAPSATGSNPAPVNSFPANAPSDSQAKPFVFGHIPTSQATSGSNMFGSTQPAPTKTSQPPMFGSNTSAFTATIGSNASAFPPNSGTSAFTSSGSGVQAENPAQNSVSFGSSGTQPTFGTGTQPTFGNSSQPTFGGNSQPAFGGNTTFTFGNSTPASKVTFGNVNNTQTNSTPATNLFGSKPYTFGENTNAGPNFGTPNATPAQTLSFGNSLAQNNSAITNPSTPLNFGTPAPAENKLAFGSQFGQNSPAGQIPFTSSTPSFAAPGSFGPGVTGQGTPGSFSIGLISKPSGSRQRVMARRQHQRKK